MSHLRPYCAHNAIFEAFIRPAISATRCYRPQYFSRRTFIPTFQYQQKLSRKQREQTGVLTPEDQERIRKAKEKAERRAATEAPKIGFRAKALLKAIGKEVKAEKQAEEQPLKNDEIKNRDISLVDREGRYHKRIATMDVLWNLNRAEEVLMMVKAADKNDPRSIPLCKIYALGEVMKREQEKKSKEAQREKGEKMAKELELTWTIGPADMDLKCKQLTKFLEEGRKLDITISRKFKRRVPDKTHDELQAVVDRIRAAAMAVKGAREYKEAEGQLAQNFLIFLEGPKGGLKDQVDSVGVPGPAEPKTASASL